MRPPKPHLPFHVCPGIAPAGLPNSYLCSLVSLSLVAEICNQAQGSSLRFQDPTLRKRCQHRSLWAEERSHAWRTLLCRTASCPESQFAPIARRAAAFSRPAEHLPLAFAEGLMSSAQCTKWSVCPPCSGARARLSRWNRATSLPEPFRTASPASHPPSSSPTPRTPPSPRAT